MWGAVCVNIGVICLVGISSPDMTYHKLICIYNICIPIPKGKARAALQAGDLCVKIPLHSEMSEDEVWLN